MNDLVLLTDICGEYFGLSERIAQRKASLGMLPVPAFRISGTRKGPYHVRKSDLEAHIQRQIEKAEALNCRMKSAGYAV